VKAEIDEMVKGKEEKRGKKVILGEWMTMEGGYYMLDSLSTMLNRGYNNLNSSSRLPYFHVKPIEFIVSGRD
jgi:hypothetical protein